MSPSCSLSRFSVTFFLYLYLCFYFIPFLNPFFSYFLFSSPSSSSLSLSYVRCLLCGLEGIEEEEEEKEEEEEEEEEEAGVPRRLSPSLLLHLHSRLVIGLYWAELHCVLAPQSSLAKSLETGRWIPYHPGVCVHAAPTLLDNLEPLHIHPPPPHVLYSLSRPKFFPIVPSSLTYLEEVIGR